VLGQSSDDSDGNYIEVENEHRLHGISGSSSEDEQSSRIERSQSLHPSAGKQAGRWPSKLDGKAGVAHRREAGSAKERGRPTQAQSTRVLTPSQGDGGLLRRTSSRMTSLGLRPKIKPGALARDQGSVHHQMNPDLTAVDTATSSSEDDVFGHNGSLLGKAANLGGVKSH